MKIGKRLGVLKKGAKSVQRVTYTREKKKDTITALH
jgi:hypothetical protein